MAATGKAKTVLSYCSLKHFSDVPFLVLTTVMKLSSSGNFRVLRKEMHSSPNGIGASLMHLSCGQCYKTFFAGNQDFPQIKKSR